MAIDETLEGGRREGFDFSAPEGAIERPSGLRVPLYDFDRGIPAPEDNFLLFMRLLWQKNGHPVGDRHEFEHQLLVPPDEGGPSQPLLFLDASYVGLSAEGMHIRKGYLAAYLRLKRQLAELSHQALAEAGIINTARDLKIASVESEMDTLVPANHAHNGPTKRVRDTGGTRGVETYRISVPPEDHIGSKKPVLLVSRTHFLEEERNRFDLPKEAKNTAPQPNTQRYPFRSPEEETTGVWFFGEPIRPLNSDLQPNVELLEQVFDEVVSSLAGQPFMPYQTALSELGGQIPSDHPS